VLRSYWRAAWTLRLRRRYHQCVIFLPRFFSSLPPSALNIADSDPARHLTHLSCPQRRQERLLRPLGLRLLHRLLRCFHRSPSHRPHLPRLLPRPWPSRPWVVLEDGEEQGAHQRGLARLCDLWYVFFFLFLPLPILPHSCPFLNPLSPILTSSPPAPR
jgi:hypothetical protein